MSPQPGNGDSDSPLEDVSLVYFDANPTHLNPFQSSLLRWKVTAPHGVQIHLDETTVPATGEEWVEPASTRNYSLVAKARGESRALGNAEVTVNLSQCRGADLSFLDAIIRAGLLSRTDLLPSGVYYREDPRVTVTPDQIQIHLFMGKSIPVIRNPDITIDMSFGLTLAPDVRRPIWALRVATRLAPINESYSPSVTEPWYVWLIPGLFPGLAIALGMALT
jgi:hypothetical protein